MTEDTRELQLDEETPRPGESFLRRFNRRKTEARLAETQTDPLAGEEPRTSRALPVPEADPEPELTDADMPPLGSLGAESDYSGFLSPKVSESLRRAALRKLFHGSAFNVIDELDDYAEDFTTFEALGDIITSDMRHQLEVEAKKKAAALEKSLLEDDEQTEPGTQQVLVEEQNPEAEDAGDPTEFGPDGESTHPASPQPVISPGTTR